jgi:cytochrome c peroxidase
VAASGGDGMMKAARLMILSGVAIVLLLLLSAATADAPVNSDTLWEQATLYFEPLPAVAASPDRPINEAKVELGRKLYFDSRLSRKGTISCNSCHSLAAFGVDGLATSPGDEGQLGDRNSPTVLNAALHGSQFWDGRAADVEEQAGMPILNPVEMAIPSEEFLLDRLSKVPDYEKLFRAAFPGDEQPLSYPNIGLALGAFERTLLTSSPFDSYLNGDRTALGARQLKGLELFFDLGCASCHNGVNLGAASFRKFGLNADYWVHTKSEKIDEGRLKVTGDEEDRYVFRVASLRNVAETGPFFHDGSVDRLDEAVKVMVRLQVGMELEPKQVGDLTAFLQSLTGALDPKVQQGVEAAARGH